MRVGRQGWQAMRAGALGVWHCLQRQQLAGEVKGSNRRLCDRRLWQQVAAAVVAAAALAKAVEVDSYGGDGRLWRRRNEQRQQSRCVFLCLCLAPTKIWLSSLLPLALLPLRPQRRNKICNGGRARLRVMDCARFCAAQPLKPL
jgi:hypothetical protein